MSLSFSRSSVLLRKVLPDIRLRQALGPGLRLEASLKKHLGLFRPSTLARETETVNRILASAAPEAVIYDVGANIGLYTLLFARGGRKVLSFEPGAQALEYLRRNVELNGLNNVEIHAVLVSDRVGEQRFALDEVTTAASHVARGAEPAVATACTDLDSYVSRMNLPLPGVVKIDVEEHDEEVLLGMRKIIAQCHPVIFLEGGARDAGGRLRAAPLLLESGYELWDLRRENRVDAAMADYAFLALAKRAAR